SPGGRGQGGCGPLLGPDSGEVAGAGRHDAVLACLLRALERRPAGLEQRLERQVAFRHEARNAGTDSEIASVAVTRVMDQQVPNPLRDDLRILRSLLRRITLSQSRESSALPTPY